MSSIKQSNKKYGVTSFQMTPLYYGFDDNRTPFTMEEIFIREYNSHYKDGYGYKVEHLIIVVKFIPRKFVNECLYLD